jgi:DNA polymerase (family 10)
MAKTDTKTVVRLLREYAQRTSLRGGNPYRSKAYLRAAESLSALSQPLGKIIHVGRLTEIPGVGDAIADIITKLYETGSHPSLEKMRKEMPEGVLELFAIPGLRPDKILKLHRELGIGSLAELETAAKEDRIRKAKGLGTSLQTKILQNLAIAASGETRLHLHRAATLMEHAVAVASSEHPEFARVEIAGDFRRGCELVSDLALVAQAKSGSEQLESAGELHLAVADKKLFGAALLTATGSAEHLEKLRAYGDTKGFELKPDGLYRGKKLVASAAEQDIYETLGLQYIEPELREGRNEIEDAAKHALPKLVRDDDLRGILHCHTTASDGTETLETMAEATRERGFEYFGVADHSQSAHYAGGLSLEEIEMVEDDTKDIWAALRVRRGRALSRGQATARPSPQAVSAQSGHDRSAKKHRRHPYARLPNATIRTGALVSPACCTVAAASTYIRSSALGSYQNPAYSWQLGSKMDGTRLSYG